MFSKSKLVSAIFFWRKKQASPVQLPADDPDAPVQSWNQRAHPQAPFTSPSTPASINRPLTTFCPNRASTEKWVRYLQAQSAERKRRRRRAAPATEPATTTPDQQPVVRHQRRRRRTAPATEPAISTADPDGVMSIAAMMAAPAPVRARTPTGERVRLFYREDIAYYRDWRGARTEEAQRALEEHWVQVLSLPDRRPDVDPGAMQPSYYQRLPDTQVGDDQLTKGQRQERRLRRQARLQHHARSQRAIRRRARVRARTVRGDLSDQRGTEQDSVAERDTEAVAHGARDGEASRTNDSTGQDSNTNTSNTSNSSRDSTAQQATDAPSSIAGSELEDDAASILSRAPSYGSLLSYGSSGEDTDGDVQCTVSKPAVVLKAPKARKQSKFKCFVAEAENSVGRVADKAGSTFEGWWQSAVDTVRSW